MALNILWYWLSDELIDSWIHWSPASSTHPSVHFIHSCISCTHASRFNHSCHSFIHASIHSCIHSFMPFIHASMHPFQHEFQSFCSAWHYYFAHSLHSSIHLIISWFDTTQKQTHNNNPNWTPYRITFILNSKNCILFWVQK